MADSNIEYAIRRIADQAYLWDDDLDGRYVSWEDDEDNASWLDTEALALNLAELDGVAHEGADGGGLTLSGDARKAAPRPQAGYRTTMVVPAWGRGAAFRFSSVRSRRRSG